MKPTREDVENLYRLLLNRPPKSELAVTQWLASAPTVEWLVDRFLESEEFKSKHPHLLAKAKTTDASRLKVLIEELANRHPQRELYQPVFGIKVDHGGPVQRECIERCKVVLRAFSGMPIQNMSVLDVGCNMGYVTFYLSEHFARATGIEYDDLLFNFCVELGRLIEKNVEFEQTDFFEDYAAKSGNHDVCLLFSVIHYLVANKGLEEAKTILNDIVSRFDFTIIELSSAKDYSYMPENPVELLSELTNVDITLLAVSEKNSRPIYFIKKIIIGDEALAIDCALFPAPLPTSCTRVYFSGAKVIKNLPSDWSNNTKKHENEIAAYEILAGVTFVPKFHGAGRSERGAWICTEMKNGILLNHLYQSGARKKFESVHDRMVLVCQLLLALRELAARGLYWNDLSAHNLLISDGDLFLFDFAESGPVELNDHVVMLSWLLHDLQLERAASYETGVYEAIHAAGANYKYSRQLKFDAPKSFFAPELQWLYSIVTGLDSIVDLLTMSPKSLEKITEVASEKIRVSKANFSDKRIGELAGLVSWASIPLTDLPVPDIA